MKIFMLYDHEEHGPEDYAVTTDVTDLARLFDELWPREDWSARAESLQNLSTHVMKHHVSGAEDGNFKLSGGWGGPHLLVAELGGVYGQKWRDAETEAYRKRIGWKPPLGAA